MVIRVVKVQGWFYGYKGGESESERVQRHCIVYNVCNYACLRRGLAGSSTVLSPGAVRCSTGPSMNLMPLPAATTATTSRGKRRLSRHAAPMPTAARCVLADGRIRF
jgi:hypothetical protein